MTISEHVYREYEEIADLYDYVIPYRNRPDVTFYVDAARASGGPVLELGCGTGRVLIPTARAGIGGMGLDASKDMLTICRQRLDREPEAVRSRFTVLYGDMSDFELGRSFALITIPFRPFQHLLTVEDQLSCLRCIHRHLEPEGRLVFDVFNPSLEVLVSDSVGQELGEEPEFTTPDGRTVVRRHKFVARDPLQQVNQMELIYNVTHPDGRTERLIQAFSMRYLFRFEAEHLLVRCGFEIEHVYADYDKTPYGTLYPGELIFVAQKSG